MVMECNRKGQVLSSRQAAPHLVEHRAITQNVDSELRECVKEKLGDDDRQQQMQLST